MTLPICEYSGLRSVEGYEEKTSPQDPAVYKRRDSTTVDNIRSIHKEIEEKERQIRKLEEKRFNTIVNSLK